MTGAEAYEFYGDTIQAVYYSTSGYKTVTLTASPNKYVYYRGSGGVSGADLPDWINSSSVPYVYYGATVSDYSLNPSYLGLDINPNVHFSGCTALRFAVAGYLGSNASGASVSASAYDASFINIFSGNTLRYENTSYVQNDIYPRIWLTRTGGTGWINSLVFADYSSDTIGDVSLLRVGLNGIRLDGGSLGAYLSAPLINDTAVPEQGVITGTVPTGGGGDVNVTVNVDVDLSPLETAINAVGSDVQGIANDVSGIGSLLVVDSPETVVKLELEPIDTLPTLDYHKVIDDVDAVLDDIPSAVAGTASIWGIIGSLFTSDSIWLWLVPFCVFMCLASFVLWRR